MVSTFTPSPEQQAIIEAFKNTKRNLAARARAGTGKTRTIIELGNYLDATGIYVAFSKAIVDEVQPKLMGSKLAAKTLHSVGMGVLSKYPQSGNMDIQANKYRTLAEQWTYPNGDRVGRDELQSVLTDMLESVHPDERQEFIKDFWKGWINTLEGTAQFVRLKLVDWQNPEDVSQLVWRYRLDDDLIQCPTDAYLEFIPGAIKWMLTQGEAMALKHTIDFTDMIYWVVKWDLRVYQYKYVFIDEAQDLSPMQLALVKKLVYERGGGRVIIVGDPRQAIFAFAGADSDSFDISVKAFDAEVLPLTVTRRCARIIVHHVNQIVPDFRSVPTSQRGKIVWLQEENFLKYVQPSDMLIARLNAPLVSTALDLIAAGKPAIILGNDIGAIVQKVIEKLEAREGFTFEKLPEVLEAYTREMCEKYQKKHDEMGVQRMLDQAQIIMTILERSEAQSMDAFTAFIEKMFSSKDSAGKVILCTAHKSKGLEADRVFLLQPDRFPLNFPDMSPEQMIQEQNLYYVAQTRAKHTLVYVTNEKYRKNNSMPIYAQEDFTDREWAEDFTLPRLITAPALFALPEPAEPYFPARNEEDFEDYGDDDLEADPRDGQKLFIDGIAIPAAPDLNWEGIKSRLAMLTADDEPQDDITVIDEPISTSAPAPEPELVEVVTVETAVVQSPEPVAIPIVVPVPVVPVTRDLRKDMANKAAAEALTTERQKLIDLVMTFDLAQINAMTAILHAAATIKSATDVAAVGA